MKANNLEIAVVAIVFIFIVLGWYGSTPFFLTSILIILVLFSTNKSTAGVYLIWFFFNTSGLWTVIFKIPKGGVIAVFFAMICFSLSPYNHHITFKRAFIRFSPIVVFFTIFYLLGPMHAYSTEKIIFILYKGFLFIICFLVLLLNPHINYIKLIVLILLSIFQYYSYMQITLHWPGPDFFFDFGSYRRFFVNNSFKMRDNLINYQEIGLLSVFVFGFLLNLIPIKNASARIAFFFYISMSTCLLMILYSGSRQSLYSLPIIYFIHLLISNRITKKTLFQSGIVGCMVILLFSLTELQNKNSAFKESSGNTLAEQVNRPEEILHAFQLIHSKPLLGHGLGGFAKSYSKDRYYPHNIFLELLSETGFIGTLLLLSYILSFKNLIILKSSANSGFLILPVFCALFIRANLSSDLIETIYVFSFLVAWSSLNNFNKSKKYGNF